MCCIICGLQFFGFAPDKKDAIASALAYQRLRASSTPDWFPALAARMISAAMAMWSFRSAVRWSPAASPVERPDRVPDIRLVLHQSAHGRVRVREAGDQADDRKSRPGHVVLPDLPHRVMKRASRQLLLARERPGDGDRRCGHEDRSHDGRQDEASVPSDRLGGHLDTYRCLISAEL